MAPDRLLVWNFKFSWVTNEEENPPFPCARKGTHGDSNNNLSEWLVCNLANTDAPLPVSRQADEQLLCISLHGRDENPSSFFLFFFSDGPLAWRDHITAPRHPRLQTPRSYFSPSLGTRRERPGSLQLRSSSTVQRRSPRPSDFNLE